MSDERADQPIASEEQKIALERFKTVLGYFQYENSTFHVRNTFFMTVSIALAALQLKSFADLQGFAQPVATSVAGMIACSFGVWFAWLWRSTLLSVSQFWIARWQALLVELENAAFGPSYRMFRDIPPPSDARRHSNVHVLIRISTAFVTWWVTAWLFQFALLVLALRR